MLLEYLLYFSVSTCYANTHQSVRRQIEDFPVIAEPSCHPYDVLFDQAPAVGHIFEPYESLFANKLSEVLQRLSCKVNDIELMVRFDCCHSLSPFKVGVIDNQILEWLLEFLHVSDFFGILVRPEVDLFLKMSSNSILKQD